MMSAFIKILSVFVIALILSKAETGNDVHTDPYTYKFAPKE